jgi:hypothetical protein
LTRQCSFRENLFEPLAEQTALLRIVSQAL